MVISIGYFLVIAWVAAIGLILAFFKGATG